MRMLNEEQTFEIGNAEYSITRITYKFRFGNTNAVLGQANCYSFRSFHSRYRYGHNPFRMIVS